LQATNLAVAHNALHSIITISFFYVKKAHTPCIKIAKNKSLKIGDCNHIVIVDLYNGAHKRALSNEQIILGSIMRKYFLIRHWPNVRHKKEEGELLRADMICTSGTL